MVITQQQQQQVPKQHLWTRPYTTTTTTATSSTAMDPSLHNKNYCLITLYVTVLIVQCVIKRNFFSFVIQDFSPV